MRSSMRLFFLGLFVTTLGCANMSRNKIHEDTFSFKGGAFKQQRWSDFLTFKRVSWFRETSMIYDSLITRVPEDSPFFQWFSEGEATMVRECKSFYLTVAYFLTLKGISHSEFRREMEKNGFEEVLIPRFRTALRQHAEYDTNNFATYRITGYCNKNSAVEDVVISLPGFTEVRVSP